MARKERTTNSGKPKTDQGGINSAEGKAPSSGKPGPKAGAAPQFGRKH